jgi:predicted AlkP superfamily phosphohydrolase/phosphomutase
MNAERPVVLIGLDGATFTVLDPLARDGTMPFLAEFMRTGARGILHSTPHPLTPAAWTTVTTGRTPGNHGVYDFVRVSHDGGVPSYTLVTAADVEADTIWTIASARGCRVATLNFPCMFPAPAIDGAVVPGFVPWNYLPRAVHPRDLYARLRANPEFDARELAIDWSVERKALQGLPEEELEAWVEFHTARERQWFEIARHLMTEEPCDLTAVLFDGVDKLQHVCFHLLDPATAGSYTTPLQRRLREACLDYFRRLDGYLSQLVAMAGPDAQVVMVSDHGFSQASDRIFYANVWLEEHGYLRWADDVPVDRDRRLQLEGHAESTSLFDWSATTACALTASSNGIYLHTAPDDYDALRRRLAAELLAWRDPETGQRVVADVLLREQAFPGPYADRAPDLTLRLHDLSFLSVLRADAPLVSRRSPYGTHHPDGVVLAGGPGIRRGAALAPSEIAAVAPTLLYALGLPVPVDMDAPPLMELFEPGFAAAHPVRGSEPAVAPAASPAYADDELDADAEAQIFDRLKALGYVE